MRSFGNGRDVPHTSVSVALCTYQGEKYLQEQLDSIASQSRLPDELVVCDDGSTDGTLGILDRFRSRAPFSVRVNVNEKQLGPAKNFERAIERCEGELIFLSDQDDVWHPEKLSTLVPIFVARPQVGGVFCDADVVDERLRHRGYSVWEFFHFGASLQRKFARGRGLDVLLKHNVVAGMTMGFRASFRDLIIPIPADWFYDAWIPLLIAAVADIEMVPHRLVRYRQHQTQAIGMNKVRLREVVAEKRKVDASDFLRLADQYDVAAERLTVRMGSYCISKTVIQRLEAKVRHFRARADMRTGNGRFALLAKEISALNYRRYSSGWRSLAVDVFLS
jgi:glycosyltransferase involved in cell wall biosynthesis